MRRVIFVLLSVIGLLLIPPNLGLAQLENSQLREQSETTNTRLVVFEAFMRPTWSLSAAAGPAVDQLAQEYANQPVVFLEYNVDQPPGNRIGRWWTAYEGSGSVLLPLVMVDSGQLISNGRVDFYNVYKSMVEHELARPAQAEIEAYASRAGDKVKFSIKLTNLSGVALSYWSNYATVHGIVYEDAKVGVTNRIVREAVYESIYSEIAPDSSTVFNLETSDLIDVNWDKLHFVALVDYRPQGTSGPYDILQAALAQPIDFSIQPNQLTFLVDPGEQTTPTMQLNLLGSNTLNWTTSEDIAWLSVSPTSGVVPASPLVSVDTSKLSVGWQPEAHISFTASSGDGVHLEEDVSVLAYYGPVNKVYLPIVRR